MPDIAEQNWIEEDHRNVNAAPKGFPPGMPAYIDTAGRMVMGAVKRSWNRSNPVYVTTGTADAYVVKSQQTVTRLNLFEIITVRIHQANTTTSPTLLFSKTSAYPIMRYTPDGKVAIAVGDMVAGSSISLWWDGTAFILAGAFATIAQGIQGSTALQVQSLVRFGGSPSSSNNTAAVTAAVTSGYPIYVSEGVFQTPQATASLPLRMYGPGQVQDTAGKRGRSFSWLKQPPASLGTPGSVDTGFNGDLTTVQSVHEFRVTGNALGTPTTGYLQVPETAMEMINIFVQSGHNEGTTASGRTGFAVKDNRLGHFGQGDAFLHFLSATSAGAAKVGAVDFLANPAVGFINGSVAAQADGTYLNTVEWNHYDGGFRAAVAPVLNFFRSVDSEATQEMWMGWRLNGQGPASGDSALSIAGYWKNGLDTTAALLGTRKSAVTIAGGQRIYMNAVASNVVAWARSTGTEWLEWDTVLQQMKVVVAGGTALSVGSPSGAVNDLLISANVTGGAPYIAAQGSDAVIDLQLLPKTTGKVQFGTFTTNADAPVAGFITIKDSGGTLRKLAIIA